MALATVGLLCSCEYDGRREDRSTEQGERLSGDASSETRSGGADAISLSGVVWLDMDISGWPITTSLNPHVSGGVLWLENDKENVWPDGVEARGGGGCNANAWIFVKVDGTWYAATWEYLRRGGHHKQAAWLKGGDGHISSPPLSTWYPRSGETYGHMVSTLARGGYRTIDERSNVALHTWP
jgi:hypothetical protein